MKMIATDRFARSYNRLPVHIQRLADKQLTILLSNPQHPSLRFKKMKGIRGKVPLFEIRVTQGYRIVCQMHNDFYILYNIGTHDILGRP